MKEISQFNMFKKVNKCRCCGGRVFLILDLNSQPLANSYHSEGESLPEFPLSLNLCPKCYHMQLSIVVDPNIMFKNYLYVSGTTETLRSYFDFFARFTIERFKNYNQKKPINVLDIACNDGSQLDSYKKNGIKTYGIDPAENLFYLSSKNHDVVCDFFPSKKLKNKFDIITAQNVFAHTDDVYSFLIEVKKLMSKNSVIFIQTSQANMIKNNEFDTIYHEHLSFFNTLSMKTLVKRCGLNLNNVFKFDIHGTSYVFEISKNKVDTNVESVLKQEKSNRIYSKNSYDIFSKNAKKITLDLKNAIISLKEDGYKVVGYGAAAKGMTLLNFGKINLDFIIDDNKMKHGLLTPGMNIPIHGIDSLNNLTNEDKVAFIPLAWNFHEEICKKILNLRNCKKDIFIKYFPKINISINDIIK